MERLRYKLFSLYLGAMLRLQEANDEGIVYTRRITNLKPFSCFPERLREVHKNFDVYPRDKEKPIFSAYTPERIKPLTRPLVSACATLFRPQKPTYKEQCADSFTDFMRISRNSEERMELAKNSLKNGQLMREFIAANTRSPKLGSHRVAMNRRKSFKRRETLRDRKARVKYEDYRTRHFIGHTYDSIVLCFLRYTFRARIRNWTCSMNLSGITCQFDLWRGSRDKWRGRDFLGFFSRDRKRALFFLNHSGRKVNLSICGIARTSPTILLPYISVLSPDKT